MKYSINKKYITGAAIPVSALKTELSCGVGEFTDLKLFGDWCKDCGIDLIQILPVNDTGFQSSPYSAISAFALHPIYLNIGILPEAKKFKLDIEKIKKKHETKNKVSFNAILKDKLKVLNKIYKEEFETIEAKKAIKSWEKKNSWVKEYALFSYLKHKNKYNEWQNWVKFSSPTQKEIETLYKKNYKKTFFYVWVQYNLEKQLAKASKYLDSIGINLKGDIPILMNVDSVDVWSNIEAFNIKNRAGAPPDMFSDDGQNWGFPTYNWDKMKEDNYSWWKNRLKQASKFYHAYRIDHVLGFFRIWTIPSKYKSGSMGYYNPNEFLTIEDLANIGFTGDRLIWMSEPHIPGFELRDRLGLETNEVTKIMLNQIGNEDLFRFKPEITDVNIINNIEEISEEAKEKMIYFFQNIALMKIDENKYTTTWFYYKSRAFNSLSDHEKYLMSELLKSKGEKSMSLWRDQGLTLLTFMKESEDMLVCAEDLGTIPSCVPEVLNKLEILGLHVTRWSKNYNEYSEPYIKPTEYNYLSVSTPAVHDSTTVRQWWTEVSASPDLYKALNMKEKFDKVDTPENVESLYKSLLKTSSQIAMFQFQDLLAIDKDLRRDNKESERINVPGTINDENWSYRMDLTIEELKTNTLFTKKLKNLLSERG